MVPSAAQVVWSEALDYVRAHTKEQQYETWFRGISCVDIGAEEVVIATPNAFYRKWMNNHYRELLEQAFAEVGGDRVRVRFVVSGEAAADAGSPSAGAGDDAPGADEDAAPDDADDDARGAATGAGIGAAAREPGIAAGAPGPIAAPTAALAAALTVPAQPAERGEDEIRLNPEYTFENFVVGPSNRLAHAACLSVTENLAKAYNPLFLHGDVGLGKTHLLQAVCSTLMRKRPGLTFVYLACEAFVNQYISALQRGKLEHFRGRYRHVDLFVMDDIHFLASKKALQEEFFHTFNALYNAQRQIILSSDATPHDIPDLEDRLVSRFAWGLVAEIEPPGYETKCAIIRRKAKLRSKELPPEVVDYLANGLESNIRELEGAVLKVCAMAGLENRPIDIPLCRLALKEIAPQKGPVGISEIMNMVAKLYGIKLSDLQGKKRTKSIVLPRQVCMYLIRRLTPLSLQEVGGYFGGRDHTTVLYSESRITKLMGEESELKSQIDRLVRDLQRG